ncbi:MAG: hypothetical protein QW115_02870 [Thermoplasmata archaeon]
MLDRIIENLIGCMILPPGIGVNFVIHGKDHPLTSQVLSIVEATLLKEKS